jgi:hypothetical protein
MNNIKPIFKLPNIDVPPYATWVGKEHNRPAVSSFPDNMTCLNPYGTYTCPVTLCSCCAGPNCTCNKPRNPYMRRYITNLRPVYYA